MQSLIRTRRSVLQIGLGRLEVVRVADERVFAHRIRDADGSMLFVHNLSDDRAEVPIRDLSRLDSELQPIFPEDVAEVDHDDSLPLEPYAYRWFRAR